MKGSDTCKLETQKAETGMTHNNGPPSTSAPTTNTELRQDGSECWEPTGWEMETKSGEDRARQGERENCDRRGMAM